MNYIPTLLIIMPIIIGLYQWRIEQINKRKFELYIKKEKLYLEMQQNLWGFYTNSADRVKVQKFLENVNSAWLYCPDNIIEICNGIIDNRRSQNNKNNNIDVTEIANKLIAEMRKDMLCNKYIKKTSLTKNDIRNVNVS